MIEFNPPRQPIRRTPRFAACGLAAVAILAAGLSVCVPFNSMPFGTVVYDDLATVAAIPSSDHVTQEHVTNVGESADRSVRFDAPLPKRPSADSFFDPPPTRAFPTESYPRRGFMFGPSAPGSFEGELDNLRR